MPVDILILGEHDKGHGMPFSPKTVSGRRLRRLVDDAGIAVDFGNVFDYAEGCCVERNLPAVCAGYRVVVAVGQKAAAECARQAVPVERLPHPAVRSGKQLGRLREGLVALGVSGREETEGGS